MRRRKTAKTAPPPDPARGNADAQLDGRYWPTKKAFDLLGHAPPDLPHYRHLREHTR